MEYVWVLIRTLTLPQKRIHLICVMPGYLLQFKTSPRMLLERETERELVSSVSPLRYNMKEVIRGMYLRPGYENTTRDDAQVQYEKIFLHGEEERRGEEERDQRSYRSFPSFALQRIYHSIRGWHVYNICTTYQLYR